MLSEKGLLIIEKLAEHNNELVTSKALAASTGMSERSVKTYLKEVADFCEQNSMTLDRKPGKGMKPCFSDAQIGKILDVAGRKSAAENGNPPRQGSGPYEGLPAPRNRSSRPQPL